jgi:tRNA pseudouridine38-40 synthase
VNWKRAARTDKGVSAVGNVVSLRMTLHPPCMVERINEQLPEQVRGPVDCRDCSSHPATQHSSALQYNRAHPLIRTTSCRWFGT